MSSDMIKKKSQNGEDVEILGPTYEPGQPSEEGDWRSKMGNRSKMLKYLETGERYWYGDSYGSEVRKNPA